MRTNDTVLIADSSDGPQNALDKVINSSQKFCLQLNITETKCMAVSKNHRSIKSKCEQLTDRASHRIRTSRLLHY